MRGIIFISFIFSLPKYKSLEAAHAVFALNYSETRVRARRARTRTELAYRKYRREKSSANALDDRITARFTRYWSSEGLFQLSAKIDHWANKTKMEKRHYLSSNMPRYVISIRSLYLLLPDFQSYSQVNSILANDRDFCQNFCREW